MRWSTLSVAEFSPLAVGLRLDVAIVVGSLMSMSAMLLVQARPIVNSTYGAIIRGRVSFFTLS